MRMHTTFGIWPPRAPRYPSPARLRSTRSFSLLPSGLLFQSCGGSDSNWQRHEYTWKKGIPGQGGLEVVPGDDPEYVRPDHEGLELAIPPSKETRDLPTIEQRPGSKRICGLSTKVFLLVVVVCLVVVTAAVGGGVGGSVKNRKASDAESLNQSASISSSLATSSATSNASNSNSIIESPDTTSTSASSSTSAASSTAQPTSSILPNILCPSSNGSTIQSDTGQNYQVVCFTDWPSGENTIDGNDTVADLSASEEDTLVDCVDACSGYNRFSGGCNGVTWTGDLSYLKSNGGNCWLKSAQGVNVARPSTYASALLLPS
ncbi:hypothetical protein MMC20_001997 [Loxospora ochrophaea]|nr:hypothetical protein [Loxospora ochrophaea]